MSGSTMKEFEVTLVESRRSGGGVGTFRFAKPEGYVFEPGQFFILHLETSGGKERRCFSHADAPGDGLIELATRDTGSAYKKALFALAPGSRLKLVGPSGRLCLPEGDGPVGFLTGGVGVTPVMSMLRHATATGSRRSFVVFFANRDETSVPYGEELRRLARERDHVRLVEVLGEAGPAWKGERGRITEEIVRRHVDVPASFRWIVTGPPPMVEAMRPVLAALGVDPSRAAFELFAGYETA